jgi:HlyD family secretion protein
VAADVATVRRGAIAETVSDQGVVRVREAYVLSAPVTGRLERVDLEVGDRVVAGRTVVARIRPAAPAFLDPRSAAQAESAVAAAGAAVAAARAQRDRLQAEARRAGSELRRQQALARQGYAPRQLLEQAEAAAAAGRDAVQAAEAEIRARVAALAAARAALISPAAASPQSIPVTTPATGVVTRLMQESERTVSAGAPLVEIGDTTGLEAAIEFLSQDAVRVREGQRAEIYDWGGPGVIPAQVRRVEPQGFTKVSALGVEEQRALVMLQFTGAPEKWLRLGPGYRVWGRVFLRQAPDAVLAPVGALVRDAGGWAVFRVNGGRARLTRVDVGAIDEASAEIRSGVQPGEQVVVFPSDRIQDGGRVAPRRPGD